MNYEYCLNTRVFVDNLVLYYVDVYVCPHVLSLNILNIIVGRYCKMVPKNIAVIIVNGEALRGEKEDLSNNLTKELVLIGFNVEKVCIVQEKRDVLSIELSNSLRNFDFVFLCAKQSSLELIYNTVSCIFSEDRTINLNLQKENVCNSFNTSLQVPASANILYANQDNLKLNPVVYIKRLFVLIDSEDIHLVFKHIIKSFPLIQNIDNKHTAALCLHNKELEELNLCNVNNEVEISAEKQNDSLLLKLKSNKFTSILDMLKTIQNVAGPNFLYFEETDTNQCLVYQQMKSLPHINKTITYIEECLAKYGPSNCFLSFNGGKDCTVLLHLIRVVLRRNYPDYKMPIYCHYVRSQNSFKTVDKFINDIKLYYNLNVVTSDMNIKQSLEYILKEEPQFKAVFMGTRRTDPFSSNLQINQMTDSDWPQIMRVFPILDWHYSDIWDYLLMFNVPYCELYDEGYTSLGSETNTLRNPKLLLSEGVKCERYLPAYKLFDGSKERQGRSCRSS